MLTKNTSLDLNHIGSNFSNNLILNSKIGSYLSYNDHDGDGISRLE